MTETPHQKVPHGEGDPTSDDKVGSVDPVTPVDDERSETSTPAGVKDVDMEPEDHLNRPEQPDFDPAERKPFDDPDPDVLPTSDADLGSP